MFGRTRGFTFLHSKNDLTAAYGRATAAAGPRGIDSLDFLAAVVTERRVTKVIRLFGVDPADVQIAAHAARVAPNREPGLTDDAKRVTEAVSGRAHTRRRDLSSIDLLVALATADTPARLVLSSLGIDEA